MMPLLANDIDRYSASADYFETVVCFLHHPAQLASAYVVRPSGEDDE